METDTYEKSNNLANEALRRAAKSSKNELLEKVVEESNPRVRIEKQKNCIMIRKIVDECLDEYKQGQYTFEETITELKDALDCL